MNDDTPLPEIDDEPTTLETVRDYAAAAVNDVLPLSNNKSFWAGIGVGSAALVAALMYTQRGRRRK